MSTNHTPNYSLSQWEPGDDVLRADFKADNAKIDAALKAEADARAVQAAQIANLGNCQIYTTSYVGSGNAGPSYPCSLTFPKAPALVLIFGYYYVAMAIQGDNLLYTVPNGSHYSTISWNNGGKTMRWFAADGQQNVQMSNNTPYRVAAFYSAES